MKRTIMRTFLTIALVVAIMCNFNTVASAAASDFATVSSATNGARAYTIYLNDWADFTSGTDAKALTLPVPKGNHTLHYSVSAPMELYLWADAYTCYRYYLEEGSSTKTIYVPLRCTHWNVITSASGEQSCSFVLLDY